MQQVQRMSARPKGLLPLPCNAALAAASTPTKPAVAVPMAVTPRTGELASLLLTDGALLYKILEHAE